MPMGVLEQYANNGRQIQAQERLGAIMDARTAHGIADKGLQRSHLRELQRLAYGPRPKATVSIDDAKAELSSLGIGIEKVKPNA